MEIFAHESWARTHGILVISLGSSFRPGGGNSLDDRIAPLSSAPMPLLLCHPVSSSVFVHQTPAPQGNDLPHRDLSSEYFSLPCDHPSLAVVYCEMPETEEKAMMRHAVSGGLVGQVPRDPTRVSLLSDSHVAVQLQLFWITNQGGFSSFVDSWVARMLVLPHIVMWKVQCV